MSEKISNLSDLPPEAFVGMGMPAPAAPISAHVRRLKYLERMASASRALSELREPEQVAAMLAEQTRLILEADAAAVLLMDEAGRVRVGTAQGLSPKAQEALNGPVSERIVNRALTEERTLAAWDLTRVEDTALAAWAEEEGLVSAACAPMIAGGLPVGALHLYMRRSRRFSDDLLYVLSLLAGQGAIALTNARSYEALQAHSRELRQAFHRVGEALATSLDKGETLQLIVRLAVEMTRADAGAIYLMQEEREGGGLLLAGVQGVDRRSVRHFRRLTLSPYAERALNERRLVVLPDTRRFSEMPFPTLRLAEGRTAETRSLVCVPLFAGDRPLGILEQYVGEVGALPGSDLDLLAAFAHQAAAAIENARLYAQEFSIAQTLQKAFLPELPPLVNGIEVGRIYVAGSVAASVGGDTYDLLTLPDNRLVALIADVMGKGTVAATVAILARDTVRAYAFEDADPSRVLRRVNDALCLQNIEGLFLTMIYALIDPVSGGIRVASAAHPPALLCRGETGICERLGENTGLLIGLQRGEFYPTEEAVLRPGDALILYTDGIIEARRGKEQFGQERLERAFAAAVHLPAQEIAAALYAAVADFVDEERTDDIALLALKPHG